MTRGALLLALASVCLLPCSPRAVAIVRDEQKQEKITLTGTVTDAEKNPLPNARILILTGKGKVQPAKTDGEGKYTAEVPVCQAFDVLYRHSEAGASRVNQLAGNKNQTIHVRLFTNKQTTLMKPLDYYDELQTYQFAVFVAKTTDASIAKEIRDTFPKDETAGRIQRLSDAAHATKIGKNTAALLDKAVKETQEGMSLLFR